MKWERSNFFALIGISITNNTFIRSGISPKERGGGGLSVIPFYWLNKSHVLFSSRVGRGARRFFYLSNPQKCQRKKNAPKKREIIPWNNFLATKNHLFNLCLIRLSNKLVIIIWEKQGLGNKHVKLMLLNLRIQGQKWGLNKEICATWNNLLSELKLKSVKENSLGFRKA